jgi:glycosyltransferase involved in cell wall biosynthesis
MLSILIPVYNFDIRQLVYDLRKQCELAGVAYEIICLDDGSTDHFKAIHQELTALSNVHYEELPQNLGRSKIRNRLATMAQYEYLLFMDNDSGVTHPNYIQTYLDHLHPKQLLYGGRVYKDKIPKEKELQFHWYYGRQREQSTADQRKNRPYHSFMTNNFLIPKDIFEQIQFDEQLTQYGHEDTLFGLELRKHQIPIIHLDNPLEHLGLEPRDIFLEKTKKGIQNLYSLYQRGLPIETKLLNTFQSLKKWNLTFPVRLLLHQMQPFIMQQIEQRPYEMRWFDLLKLSYLLEVAKASK